ncbi:MAG: hypothetical protein AABZ60_11030 [Planctomycetota bacterium]
MLFKKNRMLINLIGVALFMATYAQDEIFSPQEQTAFIEKNALLSKLQAQLTPEWKIEISKELLRIKREGERDLDSSRE